MACEWFSPWCLLAMRFPLDCRFATACDSLFWLQARWRLYFAMWCGFCQRFGSMGYYEPRIGEVFHNYSGWLMLPISFLMLLGLIKVFDGQ